MLSSSIFLFVIGIAISVYCQNFPIALKGVLVGSDNTPLLGCKINLLQQKLSAVKSNVTGEFSLIGITDGIADRVQAEKYFSRISKNNIYVQSFTNCEMEISIHGVSGEQIGETKRQTVSAGSHIIPLSALISEKNSSLVFLKINLGNLFQIHKLFRTGNHFLAMNENGRTLISNATLKKIVASIDTLNIQCLGYLDKFIPVTSYSASLGTIHFKKPNILFFAIDDLRTELGAYGAMQVLSPNIDQFANQATVFNRAYVNNPVCGSSRASMFTGLHPTKNRFTNADVRMDLETPGVITMAQTFKEAGYYTLSNGKTYHYQDDADARSWSEPAWRSKKPTYLDPADTMVGGTAANRPFFEGSANVGDYEFEDGDMAKKSMEDLDRLAKIDKPFFLAVGFKKPHLPMVAPKKYWDMYDQSKIEVADNQYLPINAPEKMKGSDEIQGYFARDIVYNSDEWHRTSKHAYFACVSYVDKLIGEVIDKVDSLGLRENTVIVLWGDNGWNLGEHNMWGKHTTMHTNIRIPFMISASGYNHGARTEAMMESVDIFPTLTEICGLTAPKNQMSGVSLLPILKNPTLELDKEIFTRYSKSWDAIATRRYVMTVFDRKKDVTNWALFDHQADPKENFNIAATPDGKVVATKLFTSLEAQWALEKVWPF